jgi:fused signal recognition particle receptor
MDQTTTDTATQTATEIASSAARDPWDVLMNAGSDPTLLFLLAAPLALLVLVIIIYAVVVVIRNRREQRRLAKEMELSERGGPAELEPEEAEDESYPVPPELQEAEAPAPTRQRLRIVKEEELEAAAKPAVDAELEELRRTDRKSWLARLKGGLAKTRTSLQKGLESIFVGKTRIDADVLEKLHELLYRADVGAQTADKLVDKVRTTLGKDEAADWSAVATCIKDEAKSILEAPQAPLAMPPTKPWVILVVGVNGVGKTTTIGKLAAHFLADDKKVLLAAGDTFRAAAIEQLGIWGERLGVDVIKHKQGADPAAVAYDAVKAAVARQVDVLIIDTAGRLHSRNELMDELGKINRSIGKDLPGAPHETWLVIDATTGQNAVAQVKAFREVVKLTGLVVTKLDGTAKGGVLVGIADQFKLPIRYVGVGEKAADLRAFNPADFADSLL